MEISKYNKIVIVSLCDNFSNKLGNLLSQSLGMMFCNTEDLIEYELMDKNAIEKICTKQDFDTREAKVIKHIASFENVVVSISLNYLSKHISILRESSIIVFVRLSKKFITENGETVSKLNYDSRTAHAEKNH